MDGDLVLPFSWGTGARGEGEEKSKKMKAERVTDKRWKFLDGMKRKTDRKMESETKKRREEGSKRIVEMGCKWISKYKITGTNGKVRLIELKRMGEGEIIDKERGRISRRYKKIS